MSEVKLKPTLIDGQAVMQLCQTGDECATGV